MAVRRRVSRAAAVQQQAEVPMMGQPEYVDRSEMIFSYMNMIAFNNRFDLKLNPQNLKADEQ